MVATARRPSLGWLMAQLGPHVVRLDCAPRGLDVPVGDPVIYDVQLPPSAETDDLILAVGVAPATAEALDLLRWAGSYGACAAAFKAADGALASLRRPAEDFGVALMALPLEMAWDQFHTLARRVLAATAGLADDADVSVHGDVFALANAIAAMVGGSVKISDTKFEVLAYSTLDDSIDEARRHSILTRRPTPETVRRLRDCGTLGELLRSPEPIDMPSWLGTKRRLGIAIRSGEEVLGYLFVAEGDTPMGEDARRALQEAAHVAARHLLNLRSSDVVERRMRHELFRGALEGRGSVHLLASRLGADATGHFSVIAFQVDTSGGEPEEEGDGNGLAWLVDLALLQAKTIRRRAEAATIGQTLYVLLPGSEEVPSHRLLQYADDVVGSAERALRVKLRAGIGSSVGHVGEVHRSRQQADQVLQLLNTRLADRRIALFNQVRAQAFLLDLQEMRSLEAHLEGSRIAGLIRYDAEHGTPYVETLRAYLEALGDVNLAAKRVHVHRNTLRYRLRKLCELVELDLEEPAERLVCELQLWLLSGRQDAVRWR